MLGYSARQIVFEKVVKQKKNCFKVVSPKIFKNGSDSYKYKRLENMINILSTKGQPQDSKKMH